MSDKTEPVKIPIFVESPYKKVLQTPEIKKMIFKKLIFKKLIMKMKMKVMMKIIINPDFLII